MGPILPLPKVKQGRKLFVPEEDRRRSARIASKAPGKPASYGKKAQQVLMTHLEIGDIEGKPVIDCLEKYAHFFKDPLPTARVEALPNLFFLDMSTMPLSLDASSRALLYYGRVVPLPLPPLVLQSRVRRG